MKREFANIYGVDFSGGASAGKNIWIAQAQPGGKRMELCALDCLEDLCAAPQREAALAHLVKLIADSRDAVWGIDFPFGLPIELSAMGADWPGQLAFLRKFNGDAKSFGLWCVNETRKYNGQLHVRRTTDRDVKTPFDCYHYRIIYQTFHGIRDVLMPLAALHFTAILPFQYQRLRRARNVVVEACPSSTLKRMGLPHQNYKQPAGGPLTAKRRRTRREILAGLEPFIRIDALARRAILRNPGGDALDAVIAAVGTWQSFGSVDHTLIARHDRYPREGFVYA